MSSLLVTSDPFCRLVKTKYITQAEYAETMVISTGQRNSSGLENTIVDKYDTISNTFCTEASIVENAPRSSLSTRCMPVNPQYFNQIDKEETHILDNVRHRKFKPPKPNPAQHDSSHQPRHSALHGQIQRNA